MSDQGESPGGWRRGVALWLLPVAGVVGVALGAGGVRAFTGDAQPASSQPSASAVDPSTTTSSTTTTTTVPAVVTTLPAGAREVGRYKGSTDILRTPAFNVGASWAVLATASDGGDGVTADVFRAGDDPSTATPVESVLVGGDPVSSTLLEGGRFFLAIRSAGTAYEVLVLDLPG